MSLYIARRLVSLIPVLIGISLLAFLLGVLAPGDPAPALYKQITGSPAADPAAIEKFRVEYGLNDPLPIRYLRWAASALRGDLGYSYRSGRPILQEIGNNFIPSLQLALGGLFVAILIAFPLGIFAALLHNSLPDFGMRVFALMGAAMPSYWLAYLFILLFAVQLRWLPVQATGSWQALILPSLTLGIGGAAVLSRLLRSTMLDVLHEDYIRTARSKGLKERSVILRHALRNSLIPALTVLGGLFGSLLAGAVVVETVFSRPGLGSLITSAISFRDYPVIQGVVLLGGTIFVLINLLVDLSYTWIDPRIRLGGKGGIKSG
ncbi:MAG TPA: nickel ABC transporter permease [Anaerolineae bacterium]|nr:nickel ABC transporter permease [Anaerolineae bacterium]